MSATTCLSINLDDFGFVEREKVGGHLVKNRCGRDFLYYVLAYYYPDFNNPRNRSPKTIEDLGLFGPRIPDWLIWTGLSFQKVPAYLKSFGLRLHINGRLIDDFPRLLLSLVAPRKQTWKQAIETIEHSVSRGYACGLDISTGWYGLKDHVMFVYGCDDDDLYVFDTHQAEKVNYQKLTADNDKRYIMKLSRQTAEKSWSRWSRIWVIAKTDL